MASKRDSVYSKNAVTVEDAVTRELNYNYKNILCSLRPVGDLPEGLARTCCDNKFNQEATGEGEKRRCKFCKKEYTGAGSDPTEQLIAAASLWGILGSTGCLLNSQLSSTCPRLQKHSDSVASLSFGSHVNMTHSIIDSEVLDYILSLGKDMEDEEAHRERSETENRRRRSSSVSEREEDDDEIRGEYYPSVGTLSLYDKREEETMGDELHPLAAPFVTRNFVDMLSHISLSGGSLQTRGMKYKSDRGLKNIKGNIDILSPRVECTCEEAIRLTRKKAGKGHKPRV